MKTLVYIIIGGLILAKLNPNQGAAVTVSVTPGAAPASQPYGGAAATIAPVNDPYAGIYSAGGGAGGVGPGMSAAGAGSGGGGGGGNVITGDTGFGGAQGRGSFGHPIVRHT